MFRGQHIKVYTGVYMVDDLTGVLRMKAGPVVFHFEKLIPSTLIGVLTLKLSPWLRCLA
jgi:hypothetical protein